MSTLPETSSTPTRNPLVPAVLIGLAAMYLFAGYEFVRSTASTLFVDAYGKVALPYVMAAMPLGVLLMLYGYGLLLTRLGPRRTLLVTSALSLAAILVGYGLIVAGQKWACALLYVHREAYIILIVEQYWSFLNSRLDSRRARWLNGPICAIGSIGGFSGATIVSAYSEDIDVVTMLVFGAVLILPAMHLSDLAYRLCGEPQPRAEEPVRASGTLGISLLWKRRMLAFLLIVVISTQVISTVLDLAWQGALKDAIPDSQKRNAYSADLFAMLNVTSGIGQLALAPLLLWLVPNWAIHLSLPLMNLGALLYAGSQATLSTIGIAYQAFKTIDYSLYRAAKELLYIPLSFDERYRAKELIDVWGYRFSKGATSALIGIIGYASFTPVSYVSIGIGAAAVWMIVMALLLWNERKAHSSEDAGSSEGSSRSLDGSPR